MGQREEALESFRDALAIRRELASASPNTERQLALALSHERVGDELLRLHQRDEALQSFRTSFETREQIVQREPNNLEAQRVLAVSYDRIGLTLGGSSREAFEAYGKSLAIRERLADAEPRNAVWQRDLATSQE